MRKVTITIVVMLALVLAGCGGDSETNGNPVKTYDLEPVVQDDNFFIEIGGNDFVSFTGNYSVIHADGSRTQKSVDGTVPATYELSGISVACTFQKNCELGVMSVKITNGIDEYLDYTSSAYGVVSVSTGF